MAAREQADNAHAGGDAGLHAGWAVLDDDAVGRRDAERGGGMQKDVWGRLAARNQFGAVDMAAEGFGETEHIERERQPGRRRR